jgi:hypothetical protein
MSTTPGKPIYQRPQKLERPAQNVATQAAVKSLSGIAEYLAEAIKSHQQAFSELGVYDEVRNAGMLLANAVARLETKK